MFFFLFLSSSWLVYISFTHIYGLLTRILRVLSEPVVMICRNVIDLDACMSSCSTDGRVSSLCFVGNGWEARLCESAHAFWGFVHLRWSPAHQTAHPAQRSGHAVVCVQLLHAPLLPQRGRHRQGARLLHGSFQEGSAEVFLCEGQRAVLHAGHEEQNGALNVSVPVCLTVHLCFTCVHPFWTFAIWPALQSPKYQDSQTQEQFLPPGNLPYEQLNVSPIVQ